MNTPEAQNIHNILFPCVLIGCLLVVWLGTSVINAQGASVQANPATATPAKGQTEVKQPGSSAPACAISQRYPASIKRWCGLIMTYASQNGLPANLVAALILQESGGDPQAYSHSGAVGLMQVMPRDGIAASFQCASGPCFASRPTIAELKDPEYNLAYGTRYLASLLARFTGDWRAALKAYGPKDVGYAYADAVLSIAGTYQ